VLLLLKGFQMNKSDIAMADAAACSGASIGRSTGMAENAHAEGHYIATCTGPDGKVKWTDEIKNIVVNVGKNLALDTVMAGSTYTVTGPYMFLAGGTPGSAAATDTMATKTGWTEVGLANAPTYTGPRKTCAWSAASAGSKALSSALSFAITGSGTVAGCGIVLGTGAVTTIDSTAGTLYSVGAFSGGSKTVAPGDSLSVSYTCSL
jgi:hypothetical protein